MKEMINKRLSKKCNPYDYLSASARVRMLGHKIINRSKLMQMIHANNLRQAFQILNTADIGVGVDPEDYEQALNHELIKTYDIVNEITNGLELFNILRYKYDGLNIKFVLKSEATGSKLLQTMTSLGTVRKEDIIDGISNNKIPELPVEISRATVKARDALIIYNDPQKADIIIDKAILYAMYRIAHEYDNAFFQKVVRTRIDIENIKGFFRAAYAGKDINFLKELLCAGGYIDINKLIDKYFANTGDIIDFIKNSKYGHALEHGLDELQADGPKADNPKADNPKANNPRADSPLTYFEKVCDNYMLSFIIEANRVVFGVEPILGYILEKENEITSIRMVMAAKMIGSPEDTVVERLREHAW